MLKTLATRFSEPSSWAGITAGLGMIGLNLPPGTAQAVSYIGAGAAMLVAIFLPEGR